jgi:hypothetical protein
VCSVVYTARNCLNVSVRDTSMMIKNHFLAAWGDYANPKNEYIVELLSPSGMLTVQVCAAADRDSIYEQHKHSHYVTAATDVTKIPKLKLMRK